MEEQEFENMFGKSPKQVSAELKQFNKDLREVNRRYDDLLEKYPDQWIGFSHGQVHAVAPTHEVLLERIDELGVNRNGLVVQYLNTNPPTLILSSSAA